MSALGKRRSMRTTVWKDPVWSQVIATVIFGAVANVIGSFFDWRSSIPSSAPTTTLDILSVSSTAPMLLFGIAALFAMLVIGLIVHVIKVTMAPPPQFPWRNYTSDMFFGVEWHLYYARDGVLEELQECCSVCHVYLLASYGSADEGHALRFTCHDCGSTIGPFEETCDELHDKVERLVRQRIKSGSWKASGTE